jgi:transposase
MITPPPGVRVYLACGYTDMRKGMATLAMLVQQTLSHEPFSGAVYAFRGRRGGLIKVLWHDGVGMCLFIKRLDAGSSSGRCRLLEPYRSQQVSSPHCSIMHVDAPPDEADRF